MISKRKFISSTICGLLLLVNFISLAQKDTIFYDRNWNESSRKYAGYFRLLEEKEKNTLWYFEDYYFENNQIQNSGYLSQLEPEVREQRFIWYHKNGNKRIEGDYNDNLRVGPWNEYHENGELSNTGSYEKGRRSGTWKWFHPGGEKKSEGTYLEGELDGKRIWWHPDGSMRGESHFANGKLDSLELWWHENGNQKTSTGYSKGIREGEKTEWYLTGQKKSQQWFVTGIEDTTKALFWDQKGELSSREQIKNIKENHNLLWEIAGNGLAKPSYLFGTMHVKDKRAFEFSDSMIYVFNEAEAYSMEIHPDSMFAFTFGNADNTAHQILGNERLTGRNHRSSFLDFGGFRYNRPWVLNLNSLFHRDYKNEDGMPYFIDVYLFYVSTKMGKKTYGLERVKDHIKAGQDLPSYQKSYDILSKFDADEEMIAVYNEGNIGKINALMNFMTNEEFKYRLLTLRNYIMADQIDSLIKQHVTFNTCGAGHLPGEEGVIELLKKKGYRLRPVGTHFSGDSIGYTFKRKAPKWTTYTDNEHNYQISAPGKRVFHDDGSLLKYRVLDMIDEIGYSFACFDFTHDTTLHKSNEWTASLVEEIVNAKEQELTKNDTWEYGDLKGKELEYTDEHGNYNKVKLLLSGRKIYFMQYSSKVKDDLNGNDAFKFFNSFQLIQAPEIAAQTKSRYKSKAGAFAVVLPQGRKSIYVPSKKSYSYGGGNPALHIVSSLDTATGDKFVVRYNDVEAGTYGMNDSTIFAKTRRVYAERFGELIDSNTFERNGYSGYQYWYKVDGNNVLVGRLQRGIRGYTLIAALGENTKKSVAESFMNSFELLDFEKEKLVHYISKQDSFEVLLPDHVQDQQFGETRHTYSNSFNWEYDYDSYAPDYTEYGSWVRSQNRYSVVDTLNSVSYIINYKKYSTYASFDNFDSICSGYANRVEYHILDTLSVVSDSGQDWSSREWFYQLKKKKVNYKLLLKQQGNHLMTFSAQYPVNFTSTERIDSVFNSIVMAQPDSGIDLYADKKDMLYSNLSSKDSLTETIASGAVLIYSLFDSTDLPRIYVAIEQETIDSANQRINSSYDLMEHLLRFQDSLTVPFLTHYHDSLCADEECQAQVLNVLKEIPNQEALSFYMDQMANQEDGSWDFAAFYDSIPLVNQMYGKLIVMEQQERFQENVLELTNSALETKDMATDSILAYEDTLLHRCEEYLVQIDSVEEVPFHFRGIHNEDAVLESFAGILGHLSRADEVKDLLSRIFDKGGASVKVQVIVSLASLGFEISEDDLHQAMKNQSERYWFMQKMKEAGRADILPKDFLSKDRVQESRLMVAALNSDHSGHDKLEKIEHVKTFKKSYGGEKVLFYGYTYYSGYNRKKRVAIVGPQPLKKSEVDLEDDFLFDDRLYVSKSELDEQLTTMMKNMMENPLNFSWYEDDNEDWYSWDFDE